ncbi:hypothetical protein HY732_01010 [Candidatus Uhrbacteria bacterium]|nr:hypothetical protein [Candidatus Uhrbacteria bacterium]
MDILSTIAKIGLEEKQALVYTKALELGEASMTELARHAHLKRPTCYLAVEQLLFLGLLSQAQKGKRNIYSAVHPRRLLELSRFRARQIQELLPELVALYNAPKEKPRIQVLEGLEGIKALYRELYDSLNNKEEALWITRIGALRECAPEALEEFKRMIRSLSNPLIRELIYGDDEGRRWAEDMKCLQGKNHHIRMLPTIFEFGFSDNLIFGDKLVIFSFKKEAFVTTIESGEVTKTYRALFEWAWKQGKECS